VSVSDSSSAESQSNAASSNYSSNVSTTDASNKSENSSSSPSLSGKRSLGEVSEGMNAEYRMAVRAGIVKGDYSEQDIEDFYYNVQDNAGPDGNGSFTYNGKTVYVQKTYQGNPNGIQVNGETYTDPDRYTIYVDN
jgi:hypothetical protein